MVVYKRTKGKRSRRGGATRSYAGPLTQNKDGSYSARFPGIGNRLAPDRHRYGGGYRPRLGPKVPARKETGGSGWGEKRKKKGKRKRRGGNVAQTLLGTVGSLFMPFVSAASVRLIGIPARGARRKF